MINRNDKIIAEIEKIHKGDKKQLEVILSDSSRVIVEAPAGYGKTTTMVSRIAYLYSCGLIPNPKRLLGLTFSVNAALKIKKDIAEKLPALLGCTNNPLTLKDSLDITNYHGFCKKVIKKYGYLLTPLLKKDPNTLRAIGEIELKTDDNIRRFLLNEEIDLLLSIESSIKNSVVPSIDLMTKYSQIVIDKLLISNIATHTSFIIFTILLFELYPEVKNFYQQFYPVVVVDEFQDTNCISWELIQHIVNDKTKLLFLGDSLQRIYGFIGAVPNIMQIAENRYSMERIELSKNYRFMSNEEMLKLDRNIRINAQKEFNMQSIETANIPGFYGKTQEDECDQVCKAIQCIVELNVDSKVAILFRSRNKNVEVMQRELENSNIDYFYGMFTDEDEEYIEFHKKCQIKFINLFGYKKTISNFALDNFYKEVASEYSCCDSRIVSSLLILLEAFIYKVKEDYKELQPDDKYTFILDVFENRQLKQAMEYIKATVILSTVHGAKGLEWDYVVLSDLEPWIFPSFSCCNLCSNKFIKSGAKCSFPSTYEDGFVETMLEELSVFYVAITRAKKQIFVSASGKRLNNNNLVKDSKFSCYANLPGIKLIEAKLEDL